MREPDSLRIAGSKTCGDWRTFRTAIKPGDAANRWKVAYRDFFKKRIDSRYLKPIRFLSKGLPKLGEGFSIVALHCTLVEFLESTIQGTNYRYVHRDRDLGPFEYRKSESVFVSFLSSRTPFDQVFDNTLAAAFYKGVRCGLLHEARTRGGWRINVAQGKHPEILNITDPDHPILFRDNFANAFRVFLKWYGVALTTDIELQTAFIRKFDKLCDS